jgi:hypothetical protein
VAAALVKGEGQSMASLRFCFVQFSRNQVGLTKSGYNHARFLCGKSGTIGPRPQSNSTRYQRRTFDITVRWHQRGHALSAGWRTSGDIL